MALQNIYSGSIVILVCVTGYLFSFRCLKNDKYTWAVIIITLCGLLLRIYTSLDPFLHTWDERYHALVAKHLISNWLQPTLYSNPVLPFDFKNWTQTHTWLHKQPMSLWLIALCLKTFGITEWAVRMPSVILSTLCILLTCDTGKQLYDKRTGFVAGFLFSIHGFIIELCSGRIATDHVDTIFLFFVLLAIWAGIKQLRTGSFIYLPLTGLSMGAALLTKWLPALIVLPIWCSLSYSYGKQDDFWKTTLKTIVILLIAALVALPWQLYIHTSFPLASSWENMLNAQHFYTAIEGNSGSFFYYFDDLRMRYGELVYLPVLWFSYRVWKYKKQADIAVATWFWLPYIFFSFAATKMPAYTLICAPAIFIITSRLFIAITEQRTAPQKWYLLLIAYPLLLLPGRYTVERVKPFTRIEDPVWMNNIRMIQKSGYNSDRYVLFNCPHPIEMMFHTNCIAYEMQPDPVITKIIKAKGYNIFIIK